jgi:hypothetical protein
MKCPVCKRKLVTAIGIAQYCPDKKCPVFDNADNYKSKSAIIRARKQMKSDYHLKVA